MNNNMGSRIQDYVWTDKMTYVVVRQRSAVCLSSTQFLIFCTLHNKRKENPKDRAKSILTRDLSDLIYRGVANPPEKPLDIVAKTVRQMNKKLAHIKLKVRCINRKQMSEYRLEAI